MIVDLFYYYILLGKYILKMRKIPIILAILLAAVSSKSPLFSTNELEAWNSIQKFFDSFEGTFLIPVYEMVGF